jgi:hypothetical protein
VDYLTALRTGLPEAWSIEQVLEHRAVVRQLSRENREHPEGLARACRAAAEARYGLRESDRDRLCPELRPWGDCGRPQEWGTARRDVVSRSQQLRECARELEDRSAFLSDAGAIVRAALEGTHGEPLVDPSPLAIPATPRPLRPTFARVEILAGGIHLLWQGLDLEACPDERGHGGCERLAFARIDWSGRAVVRVPENPTGLWVWTHAAFDEEGRLVSSGTCRDDDTEPMQVCLLRESVDGKREEKRVANVYPQLGAARSTLDEPLPADAPDLVRAVVDAHGRPRLSQDAIDARVVIWQASEASRAEKRPLDLADGAVALRRTGNRLVLERRSGTEESVYRATVLSDEDGPIPVARLHVGPGGELVILLGRGQSDSSLLWSRDGGFTWVGDASPPKTPTR